MVIQDNLKHIKSNLPDHVTLVAVSKTKSISEIMEAYHAGHRIFGENKIQEMVDKYEQMPKDIEWHMIGHVQSNKVKYMAHFVYTFFPVTWTLYYFVHHYNPFLKLSLYFLAFKKTNPQFLDSSTMVCIVL